MSITLDEFDKKIKSKIQSFLNKIETNIKEGKEKKKEKVKGKEELNDYKFNDNYINEIEDTENNLLNKQKDFWEEESVIKIKHSNEKEIGKLEIFENNILINEIIDHNNKIVDSFYNKRLNMFATSSFDGFICVYILPKKLISMIKHPDSSYYDNVLLSSNPFPSIIAFDKKENILNSYSLSGIMIKSLKFCEEKEIFQINHAFNLLGGTFKDIIYLYSMTGECKIYDVPFFNMIEEEQIKCKSNK